MKLKSVQQFITYNNIIPIGLGIVFLGGALASAQTAGINFSNFTAPTNPAHVDIDTRAIEQVDFINHNFNPTVDVVQETDRDYVLTVGLDDYDIRNSAWQSIRLRHTIEIRKSLINSTEELQEKISVEVNDLVESRRILLQKAQTMALESQQAPSVDLASLLGGVDVQEQEIVAVNEDIGSGFVQGSHRPEDRVNPEQNIISTIVGFVTDPFVESTPEPVIAQTREESSNSSDNVETASPTSETETSEYVTDNQDQSQESTESEAATTTATSTDTDTTQASSSSDISSQEDEQATSTEVATTTASSTTVTEEETSNEEPAQEEPDSQGTATSSQETVATEEESNNEESTTSTSSQASTQEEIAEEEQTEDPQTSETEEAGETDTATTTETTQ